MLSSSSNQLARTSPEEQGLSSAALLAFVNALNASEQEIHSFMLLRHGCVVAEGWWAPYGPNIPHMMFSLSKSFASTAVGMAIDAGYFSVDDPVISFFPDDLPTTISENLAEMRVRHLLTMSSGHDVPTFPYMYDREDGNWPKGFFETLVVHQPGTLFLYNTGASYMLSEIVQRTSGQDLMRFLTPRLFEPLGIQSATWMTSPKGIALGGVGLSLTTEDIARFGQLYLQKGLWQGERLLSEGWIEDATSAQIANGTDPDNDWNQGYGYQFWRCRHGLYRGDGAFGQFCIVMDEYDAVLAMTSAAQDMQQVMNIVWENLLPALQQGTNEQVSEATAHLSEATTGLKLSPLKGLATSPNVLQMSGEYTADANRLGIQGFLLTFSGDTGTLKMQMDDGIETIVAPFGRWQEGTASFFDEIWLDGTLPLLASGAWVAENKYAIQIRLYETPYIYTLNFELQGDMLTVVIEKNVSLISKEPHTITARRQ